MTLISGAYKILIGEVILAGWTGPQFPNQSNPNGGIPTNQECGDSGCLYNIMEDPEERVDLAKTKPDILKEMQQKLVQYQAMLFNPNCGKTWPGACTAAVNTYGGFWGPFLPWYNFTNLVAHNPLHKF